jgi:hypothetical protein
MFPLLVALAVGWTDVPGQPDWQYRYEAGRLVAGRNLKTGATYAYADSRWIRDYGVAVERLDGTGERFIVDGQVVLRAEALGKLGDRAVPDDAACLRLTILGDAAARRRVRHDLDTSPALAPWRERLVVQDYPPEHWAIAGMGFVTTGSPTLYVQTPDGTVLHRQDDYADGADGLARALRRADASYDARRDPDLRRPLVPFRFPTLPLPAWLLLGGAAYLLLGRRNHE